MVDIQGKMADMTIPATHQLLPARAPVAILPTLAGIVNGGRGSRAGLTAVGGRHAGKEQP